MKYSDYELYELASGINDIVLVSERYRELEELVDRINKKQPKLVIVNGLAPEEW